MTPWRIGRGWCEAEIRAYLAALEARPVGFTAVPGDRDDEAWLAPAPGWSRWA